MRASFLHFTLYAVCMAMTSNVYTYFYRATLRIKEQQPLPTTIINTYEKNSNSIQTVLAESANETRALSVCARHIVKHEHKKKRLYIFVISNEFIYCVLVYLVWRRYVLPFLLWFECVCHTVVAVSRLLFAVYSARLFFAFHHFFPLSLRWFDIFVG